VWCVSMPFNRTDAGDKRCLHGDCFPKLMPVRLCACGAAQGIISGFVPTSISVVDAAGQPHLPHSAPAALLPMHAQPLLQPAPPQHQHPQYVQPSVSQASRSALYLDMQQLPGLASAMQQVWACCVLTLAPCVSVTSHVQALG
jgi:hypothetical protein